LRERGATHRLNHSEIDDPDFISVCPLALRPPRWANVRHGRMVAQRRMR